MSEITIDPGLEADYNLRARHPDHPLFFARWAKWSGEVRARRAGTLDLRYGPGPGERVDVFPAAGAGAPLNVFIHGGYWRSLAKSDFSFVAEGLGADGAAVAVVDYDLAPAVTLEEIVAEVRRAVLWLAANAREFGADAGRLFVSGHSAGAHLVAALMTDAACTATIAGGTAISGLFELEPLLACSVNEDLRLDAAAARGASPIHDAERIAAPLIVAVGADETSAFVAQSRDFAERCRATGVKVAYREVAGRHHFDIVEALFDPDDPLTRAIRDQMSGHDRRRRLSLGTRGWEA